MTKDDEHNELGRMVVERVDARRKLACVEHKLSRFRSLLLSAGLAITNDENWRVDGKDLMLRRLGGGSDDTEDAYPSPEEFSQALQTRRDLKDRIAEINQRFDDAGC